jgi:protein SCO1/2
MAQSVTMRPAQRLRGVPRAWCCAALLAAAAGTAGTRSAVAETALLRTAAVAQPQFTIQPAGSPVAPDVALTSMGGSHTRLPRALDVDAPLVLNFVFTTCSATCPVQTATLAEAQRRLAANGAAVRFVSITIDPDNDTPEQLARYARTFQSGPGWDFYTGGFDDLLRVQQAFGVYRGAKMSHPPVLLMRRSRTAPWQRIEGFPTAADVVRQVAHLPAG